MVSRLTLLAQQYASITEDEVGELHIGHLAAVIRDLAKATLALGSVASFEPERGSGEAYEQIAEHARKTARAALSSRPAESERDEGPQPVAAPRRLTCTGCKHLRTKWWKDYLDNDETDSGTSARCAAVPTEHGGKSITAYWSDNSSPPKWCPFAESERVGGEA